MAVRFALESDATEICAIYAPHVTEGATSFEDHAPDVAEMARRIAAKWPTHPWLVDTDDHGVAGYAYAAPYRDRAAYRWVCEVSAYVRSDRTGRGVGKRLYAHLIGLLTAQGYTQAYGGMTLPNPASAALHESAGFRRFATYENVGFKNGAWRDVGWWALDLAPRRARQPDIRPLSEIMDRDADLELRPWISA